MANYATGSLTFSGPRENVLNFLNKGITFSHGHNETPPDPDFFFNEDNEVDAYEDNGKGDFFNMWIRGSSRHFIDFNLEESFIYDPEKDKIECYSIFEAAWGVDVSIIYAISMYGLHVEVYAEEWSMMFVQNIIYENGNLLKDSYRKLNGEDYEEEFEGEEYDWEEDE